MGAAAGAGGLHPELARLLGEYERIVDAVTAQTMSFDQARELLGLMAVSDPAGAVWSLDEEGNFTRRATPELPPERTDPALFGQPASSPTQPGAPMGFGGPAAPPGVPGAPSGFGAGPGGGWHAPPTPPTPPPAWGPGGVTPSSPAGSPPFPPATPPGSPGPGVPAGGWGGADPGWGPGPGGPGIQQFDDVAGGFDGGSDEWGGATTQRTPRRQRPRGRRRGAGAAEALRGWVFANQMTVIVAVVALVVVGLVVLTRGGGGDDADGGAASTTTTVPGAAAPALPTADDRGRVQAALTSGDPSAAGAVVAGGDGPASVVAAQWFGLANLGYVLSFSETASSDAGPVSRFVVVNAAGMKVASGQWLWGRDGDVWVLAEWPQLAPADS
jgi:hypothetical protein